MKGLLLTAALSAAGLAGLGNLSVPAQNTRAHEMRAQEMRAPDLSAEEDPQEAGVFDRWLRPNARNACRSPTSRRCRG